MLTTFLVRRSVLTLLACFVLLTCTGHVLADEAVQLVYKWTKGQIDRYRLTMQSDAEVGMGKSPMKVSQKMVYVIRNTVQDVDADGTATIETVYERLQMDMDNPMSKIKFDSAKPDDAQADNPMLKSMLMSLNEPFTIIMSSRGEIKDVKGMDKIIDKMEKDMPTLTPEMKKALGSDGFKDMMSQGGMVFPTKPVVVGDSWTRTSSTDMPMFGTMKSTIVSTLKRTEQEPGLTLAAIESDTTIERTNANVKPLVPGMVVKLTDGRGTSSSSFDMTAGRLLKQTGKMNITIDMTMPGQGGNPGMNMTQKMTMTITNELLGPEEAAAPAPPPGRPATEKKQD